MGIDRDRVDRLAKMLWDYHHLHHKLIKADIIFVFGSTDLRVVKWAIELFKRGLAPMIIFTGGFGKLSKKMWDKTEAEKFAEVALKHGIPSEKILIENKSKNTGENINFAKQLLRRKDINHKRIILVTKPYMERRAYATFKKLWPKPWIVVTSPNICYEDYPDKRRSKEEFISLLVGDTQRIKLYAKKGFQIRQSVPKEVWRSYKELVDLGYTKFLAE